MRMRWLVSARSLATSGMAFMLLLSLAGCSSEQPVEQFRTEEVKAHSSAGAPDSVKENQGDRTGEVEVQDNGAAARKSSAKELPKVVELHLSPRNIRAGLDLQLQVVSNAQEGQYVDFRYRWFINGERFHFSSGAMLPGDSFVRGDRIYVEVTPTLDGQEGYLFRSDEFVVPNAKPEITSKPAEGAITGSVYTYQLVAADVDADELRYALKDSPAGMTIDAGSGLVRWDFQGVQAATYGFTMVVTDALGGESAQKAQIALEATQEGVQ